MTTRLRIVNEGDIAGPRTRLELVDDKTGDVEDITTRIRVTKIDATLKVGEPSLARLECICVLGAIDATLDDLVVRHLGPSRWRRALWQLTKWWWGVRRTDDVTSMGDDYRTHVALRSSERGES